MTALWTSADAVAATGGQTTAEWAATGVSIDTRTIKAGDLFVALTDVRDGHDFVAQALEKGAAAALVTHRPDGVTQDAPLLIVDDVLHALERLGRAARGACCRDHWFGGQDLDQGNAARGLGKARQMPRSRGFV